MFYIATPYHALFFSPFGPSPVFTNSERTCDKDFIIRRAATNRVLNVLRHWVSKHSQVCLHPLLSLYMCGSSIVAGWSSLSALLLEQVHCRMHTNSHWTPLACQLDNQSQSTYLLFSQTASVAANELNGTVIAWLPAQRFNCFEPFYVLFFNNSKLCDGTTPTHVFALGGQTTFELVTADFWTIVEGVKGEKEGQMNV